MKKLRKIKNKIKGKIVRVITLNLMFPFIYNRAVKKQAVDPNKIVFIEMKTSKISNSFKVIYDEIVNKYDFDVQVHFLLLDTIRYHDYLDRCKYMLKDIASAKYVFINEASNSIGAIKFRPETKHIQLWHGCGAFKKFGMSTGELIFGLSCEELLKHPNYNVDCDLVTVSSPEVKWAYEEAMNYSKESGIVRATGISRTDVFYDESFIKNAYENFYDLVPQAKGKKVILYAPTFRGKTRAAKAPKMFNLKMFYDKLGEDYFILFKHHPFIKNLPAIPNEYTGFAMDVTRLMDIEDLLCVSDICITDYSSLVFEYSIFEKPIIFFAYDLDNYCDWRGFYYDYFEMSPGPVCTTNLEVIECIKSIDENFDKQKIKDFRYKFMRSCDGNSTKRILDDVFGDEVLKQHRKECKTVLPYNLVPDGERPFKDRLKCISKLNSLKKRYSSIYEKSKEKAIKHGKIVLLDCGNELNRLICSYYPNALCLQTNKREIKKVIDEISTAEYIFVEKDNSLLDMIDLKDGTTVVYVPEYSFPFEKFEKDTLEYKSRHFKEMQSISPTNKRVDKVSSPNEIYDDIYCESIGVGKENLVYVGDVKTDCFFDDDFKSEAMRKLKSITDIDFSEKRILLDFVQRSDNTVPDYESECDSYLYDSLNKDFVILKFFEIDNMASGVKIKYTPSMTCYKKGFVDITDKLSVYEAIAVSDVIIGSVTNSFFLSFASMKPAFAFVPELRKRLYNKQINFKYDAVLPVPSFTDSEALAIAIKNSNVYDYSKLNKFTNTFFNNPDGKSTKRLLEKLSIIE